MIKSMTQVVITVVLSFGAMAVGVNPGLRAEIQVVGNTTVALTESMIRSASISLSNAFSGNTSAQGSVTGPANTGSNLNAPSQVGVDFSVTK